MTAIAQLPKTGVCTAIASKNTGNDGQVGYYKTFAVFGTCQVSLGAFFAATVSLPCSQLATYATNVVNACQTPQALTNGIVYPMGNYPNGPSSPAKQSLGNGMYVNIDAP